MGVIDGSVLPTITGFSVDINVADSVGNSDDKCEGFEDGATLGFTVGSGVMI